MSIEWTKEWPTIEGVYWFYGWRFKHDADEPPSIHFVEVHKASNGILYVARGNFMWKEEGAEGIWLSGAFPDRPSWDELNVILKSLNNPSDH